MIVDTSAILAILRDEADAPAMAKGQSRMISSLQNEAITSTRRTR